jgi:uncharacterized protein (DUF1697 family)
MNMKTFISMLRGINVGGQKKISMEELKKLYGAMGFVNVRTYIQSGNVIFESPGDKTLALAKNIQYKIKQSFGFDVHVVIRTLDEFRELIAKNPFVKKDPSKLHVTFLTDAPQRPPIDEINYLKDKAEDFCISGREIYLFCPNGYGTSALSNNFFEKKLKMAATTRNWNTVNTLFSLAGRGP